MDFKKVVIGWLSVVAIGVSAAAVYSYTVEQNNEPNQGVFAISPSRVEVEVEPGQTVTQRIIVANRLGRPAKFLVSVEAFVGSQDPDGGVVFSGSNSPLSATSWLKPELSEFTLQEGERIFFNIDVNAPSDASPGGHYGAVFFESQPLDSGDQGANVKLITRVGSLLLINVKGLVNEQGRITQFTTKKFKTKGPIDFDLIFSNYGNTHQAPHGFIEIKNIFGTVVGKVPVEAWYVLPDSQRRKQVSWEKEWLWGYYTATAKITHGRTTVSTEQATINFIILPWRVIGLIFLSLVVLWWLWRKYFSRLRINLQPSSKD